MQFGLPYMSKKGVDKSMGSKIITSDNIMQFLQEKLAKALTLYDKLLWCIKTNLPKKWVNIKFVNYTKVRVLAQAWLFPFFQGWPMILINTTP